MLNAQILFELFINVDKLYQPNQNTKRFVRFNYMILFRDACCSSFCFVKFQNRIHINIAFVARQNFCLAKRNFYSTLYKFSGNLNRLLCYCRTQRTQTFVIAFLLFHITAHGLVAVYRHNTQRSRDAWFFLVCHGYLCSVLNTVVD